MYSRYQWIPPQRISTGRGQETLRVQKQKGRLTMANKVTFDYSKATGFIQEHEMQYMSELAAQAKEKLVSKSGAGNDFVDLLHRRRSPPGGDRARPDARR